MARKQTVRQSAHPQSRQTLLDAIRVRGARVHNLKNIDVDIPLNKLVVITGVSGSGKSSLAYDTIYAEGQRQFLETMSVYARQFLHQLERPDVDLVENLPPTISIDQRAGAYNPRSTVATVSEIYDYLRLLYARAGVARCPKCGQPVRPQDTEQIVDRIMAFPEGTRVIILAPLVRGRKGFHKEIFEKIQKAGLVRARVDGQIIEVSNPPQLARQQRHTIEAVVDRIVLRPGIRFRISESVQLATELSGGLVTVSVETGNDHQRRWEDRLFSTKHACPDCGISFPELEPRSFSFNSPYGACPSCEGLGLLWQFDPDLVIPDKTRSLADGLIAPWRGGSGTIAKRHRRLIEQLATSLKIPLHKPFNKLTARQRQLLLYGNGNRQPGILQLLEAEYEHTISETMLDYLDLFRSPLPCPDCNGSRLRPEARSVEIAGTPIHEVTAQAVTAALAFFRGLKFSADTEPVARPIVSEVIARLQFLEKVGVGYLTLDRPTDTLSGGELQRVRLAASLGSGLVGVCYVLDEPSVGLHPRDNQRLIDSLKQLKERGNTVIVVEHDETIMRQCDWIVDLGPGPGKNGGHVVACGSPQEVAANPQSITGAYLSGRMQLPVPKQRRPVDPKHAIVLEGVTTNNLKNLTVRFPLSVFVCVTGVSGSGKSSLLSETLVPALQRHLTGSGPRPGPFRALRGADLIEKVVEINQKPIGRTPRSNPATYTGVFDLIRKVFAETKEARQLGFRAGRFSFNVKGGRCEHCQGHGQQKIEMNFLPDLYVTCPECQGKRFNKQTLQVKYRDKSIADVLEMTVDEAAEFFVHHRSIRRLLQALQDVGLGYIQLGQPSTTLSGGEAQRVKLATELSRINNGKTLYVLDEPTTGLHTDDIRRLVSVLQRLVDLGNTVIVIEHNLDVIKTADWIIDLGPEGGEAGGYLLAEGPPEFIAKLEGNETGQHLRRVLPPS